jgi:microcin C transport system permease protein
MTPVARHRWAKFRANRRGWYATWIFLAAFALSLCAELVANDRPLLVSYAGHLYAPVLRTYPETTFGGEMATEADYRDDYIVQKIKADGWILMPLIPYSASTINYKVVAPSPPRRDNWLGTDDQGRDVLARLIYGFRISVVFGLALTVLSSVIGIAAGAAQGYFGGLLDLAFQRFMEIWSGMPTLYLLIIMSSVITPGFFSLLGLMLLFSWMTLVHLVRAEFLRVRNFDYVKAARALGVPSLTIIRRHILPNATVATMTFLPFVLTGSITTLTSLDFLGLGLPPGSASLGELLAQGQHNLKFPWLSITAFLSTAILLSLLTFIGEAVRDALDPRRAGRLPITGEEQTI